MSLTSEQIDAMVATALTAIAGASNLDELKEVRIEHVGDRSPIAKANQSLGQMEVAWTSPEREAEAAKIALEVKGKLYELLSQQAVSMADQGLSNSLLGLAKVPCYCT